MINGKNRSSLPCAAEMAACFRDPCRKNGIKKRIEDHYSELRTDVPRPEKKDPFLIRKYSQIMARLRMEEEVLLEMLESFARGDANSVRETSARLTRVLQNRQKAEEKQL